MPNAGKSSLFNKLLSEDRAIVSNIAGTTRDFISEKIRIADTHFNLIDTAGVRASENIIESEGIRRALNLINKSFFKILVINPFEFDINFFKELKDINFDLIVFSHSDSDNYIASVETIKESIKDFISISGPIEPKNYGPMGANDNGSIGPSCIGSIGANLIDQNNELINTIESLVNKKYLETSSKEPIIIERHIEIINNIYLLICKYSELCSNSRRYLYNII